SLAGRYRPDASDLAIDEIAGRGRALEELLRDPDRCAFHWITLPEAVAMEEARDGVAALRGSGIAVTELLVNRVTAPPAGKWPLCAGRRACERQVIAEAGARFGEIPMRLLPSREEEPRGMAALRRLGRWLRSRPAAARQRRPHESGDVPRPVRRAARRDLWLDAIAPPGVRLLLVAGKGGGGQTTLAAALAPPLAGPPPGPRHPLPAT